MTFSNTYGAAYAFVNRLDVLSGKNQSGSFSFERKTKNWSGICYSYSTPIAKLCKTIDGHQAMLIIDGWHTRTTQKHLCALHRAAGVDGICVIKVPRPVACCYYPDKDGIPYTTSDKNRPVGYDGYYQMLARMAYGAEHNRNKRAWREKFLWAFRQIGIFKEAFGYRSLSKQTYVLITGKRFTEVLAEVLTKQNNYLKRYGRH